jgi:hypothetical protein
MNENPETVPDKKFMNYVDLEETGYEGGNLMETDRNSVQ